MFVSARVFRSLRGLDEQFFFFLEETDFCVRARKKSYRVLFVPSARVVHLQGKTVKQAWVRGRIEYAISLYKFIQKYHSGAYFKLFVLVRLAKSVLFLLVSTLLVFLLLDASVRRRYAYYSRLLLWHIQGCPDDAGLRANSQV